MASGRERWIFAAVGLGLWLLPMGVAGAEVLRISQADCLALTAHQPAPGVTFQPGRDARGRPVTPADLGDGVRLRLPETLDFAIEVDLIERLGLPLDPAEIDAVLPLGVVTLQGNEVRFNGQPLSPTAGRELADLCRAALSAAIGKGEGAAVVP